MWKSERRTIAFVVWESRKPFSDEIIVIFGSGTVRVGEIVIIFRNLYKRDRDPVQRQKRIQNVWTTWSMVQ